MADELTSADFHQGIDSVSGDVSDLSQKLDTLSTDLSQKLDTLSTDVSQKTDTLTSDLSQKLDGVTNGLDGVRDVVLNANADSVDYTATLERVGQLMAVTDILLIILCVAVFLALGLFCGFQVTRWMKLDAR